MTIDERLEKVERELAEAKAQSTRVKRRSRWLLAALGLGLGVLALVWASAASEPLAEAQGAVGAGPKIIRANRFILEDENAKIRAVLAVDEDRPVLELSDENGLVRARLVVFKGGPVLDLYDENGKARVGLFMGKDGPALELCDAAEMGRATLGAARGKTPDGKTITYPESSLLLYRPDGKVIWSAP